MQKKLFQPSFKILLSFVFFVATFAISQSQQKIGDDGSIPEKTAFPIPRVGEKWILKIKSTNLSENYSLMIAKNVLPWKTYVTGGKSFYVPIATDKNISVAMIYNYNFDPNNKISNLWFVFFDETITEVTPQILEKDTQKRLICDFPFFEYGIIQSNVYTGNLYQSTIEDFDFADASRPEFHTCELSKLVN